MSRKSFVIPSSIESANAIRRALIANVDMVSPSYVIVHDNTSANVDEHVAHTLGMTPFVQPSSAVDVGTIRARILVRGRDVLASDIIFVQADGKTPQTFPDMRPCYPDSILIHMGPDQCLEVDIEFARGTGYDNAKFSPTVAVGVRRVSRDDGIMHHSIDFDCLLGDHDHQRCWDTAMDHLESRLLWCRSYVDSH